MYVFVYGICWVLYSVICEVDGVGGYPAPQARGVVAGTEVVEVGFGIAFFAGKLVMSLGFPNELLDAF